MKASFYISDHISNRIWIKETDNPAEFEEEKELWYSIDEKIKDKVFDLPVQVTKEMVIYLAGFQNIFNFSMEEMDLITESIYEFCAVDSIVIYPDHVQLWLSKDGEEK